MSAANIHLYNLARNKSEFLDPVMPLYLIKNEELEAQLTRALEFTSARESLYKLLQTHPNEVLVNLKHFDFDNSSRSNQKLLVDFVFQQLIKSDGYDELCHNIAKNNSSLVLSPAFMKQLTTHSQPCPDAVFKTAIEAYKTELTARKEKGVSRLKLFGGYTTSEKFPALDAFEKALEGKEDLNGLQKKHPELANGRLGELFQVALKNQLATSSNIKSTTAGPPS